MTAFLRFFIWFSLRHAVRHRWRTLAVILGIGLGAAVFTSVRLSIHASLASFTQSMDRITGAADAVAARPGGRVPETLVPRLLRLPGVRTASPVCTTYVTPEGGDDPFLLIGFDPILDRTLRDWRMAGTGEDRTTWTDLMRDPFTMAVGAPLADALGVGPGDAVGLTHGRGRADFRIAGVMAEDGLALVEGGRIAVADIATFQEFTGYFGVVDRIDIALAPNVTPGAAAETRSAIGAMLPDGVVLGPPGEEKASGERMIRAYQLNLSVLSFVSLFVGMFLVYALVSLNAASRRRELAILRSVGASSRTILALFLAEGLMLGLLGWGLAMPAGALMVKAMVGGVSETVSTLFVRVSATALSLNWGEVLLSLVMTAGVAVLGAAAPAREAMTVAPREALSADAEPPPARAPGALALAGLCAVGLSWPLSMMPGPAGFPLFGYVATFMLFLGFSLMSPWTLRRLGDRLSPILNRVGGMPGYLAGRYVKDSGLRTAVSVGALITAVALFAGLVIMIHSFRGTVQTWVRQTVTGDIFLRPELSGVNRYRDALPREVVDAIRGLDEPVDLVPYRRDYLHYRDGLLYQFEAIDMATFLEYGGFVWTDGDPETVLPALEAGEGVAASEVFSSRTGLGRGDRFTAVIDGHRVDVPILGVMRDYRTKGGMVYADYRAIGAEDPAEATWSGVRFFFRDRTGDLPDRVAALRAKLIACRGEFLDITSGEELRRGILKVFDETFAITFVLLIIALVVAALGVATTLAVLVLERSRQLNTLIAVGADRGQIRAMIFWEALLLTAAGEVLGMACGFALSWLLVYVINYQSFGWTFIYAVDWRMLGLSVPLIVGAALGAAVPAVRAAFRAPVAMEKNPKHRLGFLPYKNLGHRLRN